MASSRFLARQLGNPTGIYGRFAAILWNRRNVALNDTAFDALALQPTDRVLEIGFGGGYLLGRMLPALTDGLLAGVDISPAMVAHVAREHGKAVDARRLALACAAAESLPFPAATFTKACSVNSVFYWRDAALGLAEIGRVLARGGTFVLCLTCKASLEKRPFAAAIRLFEPAEMEGLMATHGFQDIGATYRSDRHRQYACITGTMTGDAR